MKEKKELMKKYLDQAEKMTDRELLVALYASYLTDREYELLVRLEKLKIQNEILSEKLRLSKKFIENG